MEDLKKIRVRFAPSPTGYMHIGNFRTALYTYLFAKKNKGDFILRIEDTDQKRFVFDALEKLINILNWAGFEYSEGVYIENGEIIQKGDNGPYIQSERLDLYKKYAEELVEKGKAYKCFCTSERLEQMRNEQTALKKAPMYDRHCLDLTSDEIAQKIKQGEKYVIRQKIDTDGFTEYTDIVRGLVKIKNEILDDQVLMKSDGYPTYNLANVIDDHLMGITHIIRGEEFVSSTPKYIQLYQNFGWSIPQFAHLSLLLNPDKSKLSKRQGDVAVEDYIKKGYLKESIINFVAMLGWNEGDGSTQEIFSMDELIEKFELTKVHKAGAVFDIKKLDWINSQYIKKLSDEELLKNALPFFEQKEFFKSWNLPTGQVGTKHGSLSIESKHEYLKKVLTIEKERLSKFADVGDENTFFFQDITIEKEMLKWKDMSNDELIKSLELSKLYLEKLNDDIFTLDSSSETEKHNLDQITASLLRVAENNYKAEDGKIDRGALLWPLRVALTGAQKSPSPFECAWVLGKAESLKRIENAINLL